MTSIHAAQKLSSLVGQPKPGRPAPACGLVLGLAVWSMAAGGCSSGSPPAAPTTATSARSTESAPAVSALPADVRAGTDYLVLAPRSYLPPLDPLLQHRRAQGHKVLAWAVEDIYEKFSGGEPDARALYAGIHELWDVTDGRLRFVLLVGDVWRPGEESADRLPTVYLHKLRYNTHDHTVLHFRSRSLLLPPQSGFRGYPTDQPYALHHEPGKHHEAADEIRLLEAPADHGGESGEAPDPGHDHGHDQGPEASGEPEPARPASSGPAAKLAMPPARGRASLAIGRLPAREPAEVAAFVRKLIAYETEPVQSTWPRRLVVLAGPARYSRAVDAAIEATALTVLEQDVSYDYDLRLVFAKPGSAYAYRFDQLGDKMVEEVNRGALLFAYVGHSSPAYFDSVPYRGDSYSIGSRREIERIRIAAGTPLFVSLSCSAGGFDLSQGWRSLAEAAVMNPQGAIASFAASRESHPYANMLYGEALVAQFLRSRPHTVGEGVLAVKREMRERSNVFGEFLTKVNTAELKEEHASLYNLFGDPATRLRYPAVAELAVRSPGHAGAAGKATETPAPPVGRPADAPAFAAGSPLEVVVRSGVTRGSALITVETRRRVIRHPLVSAAALEKLPLDQAFARMAENHEKALDKVLFSTEHPFEDGLAAVRLTAPLEPGDYVIKAFVRVRPAPRGDAAPSRDAAQSATPPAAPRAAMGHVQLTITAP